MKAILTVGLTLGMFSTNAFSQGINFEKLNVLLGSIADTVRKAEQEKNADGTDVIESLFFKFHPDKSKLEEGKLSFEAGASLTSSAWSPGKRSALEFTFSSGTKLKGLKAVVEGKAKIKLDTDTTALVRYAYKKVVEYDDPCVGEQEGSDKEICAEIAKLEKITKFVEIGPILENVTKALLKDDSLEAESKAFAESILANLQKRGPDGSFKLPISKPVDIEGLQFTEIEFALSPQSISTAAIASSSHAAEFLALHYQDLEAYAESLLDQPDTSDEKKAFIESVTEEVRKQLKLAKDFVLEPKAAAGDPAK